MPEVVETRPKGAGEGKGETPHLGTCNNENASPQRLIQHQSFQCGPTASNGASHELKDLPDPDVLVHSLPAFTSNTT